MVTGSRTGRRVRPGTEPNTARTVVWLRVALAAVALIGFSLAAWAFLGIAGGTSEYATGALIVGVLCVLVALTAAADLVLLGIRSARGDYRNN